MITTSQKWPVVFLYPFLGGGNTKYEYRITEDADMLAPEWLAARIDYREIKFIYRIVDGSARLKGVRIRGKMAKIGDTLSFDGRRISVEKR